MTTKRNSQEIRWGYFSLIRRLLQASALLALLLSTALQAQVAVLEVRDLGTLPGDFRALSNDINNLGQAVGISQGDSGLRPFLWTQSGGIRALTPLLGTDWSVANRINDHGQVAGWSTTTAGERHAALWKPAPTGYTIQDLRTLGGPWSNGRDINQLGQVVGESQVASGKFHAFLWTKTGGMKDLHPPSAGGESYAFGINDHGQIVGHIGLPSSPLRAVIWEPGSSGYTMRYLGILPGFGNSSAVDINNLGEVAGGSYSSDSSGATTAAHAVLWKPGSSGYTMQDLGTLLGKNTSGARAINDLGMVVGESGDTAYPTNEGLRAFVWTATGGMQDLGILPNFKESFASGINNVGQVVGGCQVSAIQDPDAARHVTLWTLSLLMPDTIAPSCLVTGSGTNAAGQRFTTISCQDWQSGLASIQMTKSSNYMVSIPSFSAGTTSPVVVTATKIDNALAAWVTLKLSDVAGNIGFYDPVDLQIERTTGKPESQTLTGIPRAESQITIYNSNPGLTTLYIGVNGTKFMVASLGNNEVRNVNVSGAMQPGDDNTMTFQARGHPGGSATILIHE